MGRTDGETARAAGGTAHAVLTMFGKLLKTVLCICIITGCLVGLSVAAVIWSYHGVEMNASLASFKLKESSFMYVTDSLRNGRSACAITPKRSARALISRRFRTL